MKSVSKVLKTIGIVVVVLLVVLYLVLYVFGGRIIKVGVETAGTKALGVGVDVDSINISILGGSLSIEGLVVENPAGYTHKNLLELDNFRVKTKMSSLLKDTVQIDEIKLDGMNLVIEQKGLTNNLQTIIKSIDTRGAKKAEPQPEKQPQEKSAGKNLRVGELEITNVKVQVKLLPVPGKSDTVNINLDPIRMSNLGTEDKLSTAILAEKIMLAVAKGVAKQGAGVLPDDMVGTMKSTLDKTMGLGKTATEGGKDVIDAGGKVLEGIKGLFKPKEEE